MPQTIEAIEHSRAANVPIVVAINKIDKPDANPDRVKQELAKTRVCHPLSGGWRDRNGFRCLRKKRQNVDTLLETIFVNFRPSESAARVQHALASGVVLEAKLDRGRGPVATVLVQQGTLRTQEPFIVGQISGQGGEQCSMTAVEPVHRGCSGYAGGSARTSGRSSSR